MIDPLLDRIRAHKTELLARLHAEQKEAEIDRVAKADGWRPLPPAGARAYSVVTACQDYGVMLRIDETGDLVVGKADEPTQPWPDLLVELEAHLEPVARLVEAGWTLKAGFPNTAAA